MSYTRTNQDDHLPVPVAGESLPALAEAPPATPLRRLHRLLRGRYRWACLLGLLGALGGGWAGYRVVKPLYQSVGAIRIRPYVPRLLYRTEQSSVMPMFDSYVGTQVDLMRSRRVLDMAMQDPAWRALHRALSPTAQTEFSDHLVVNHSPGSEIITVAFTDPQVAAATAAVKATIDAYQKVYGEADIQSETQRLQLLSQRRDALKSQSASIRQQILTLANDYGSDALAQMYDYKVSELEKLETALKTAEIALASAPGLSDSGALVTEGPPAGVKNTPNTPAPRVATSPMPNATSQPAAKAGHAAAVKMAAKAAAPMAADQPAPPTIEQIAEHDQEMQRLLSNKLDAQMALQQAALHYKPQHPRRIQAEAALVIASKMVDDYAAKVRATWQPPPTPLSPAAQAAQSVALLRLQVKRLQQLYDAAKKATLALGQRKLQIDSLKKQATTIDQQLADTQARIEQLNVESAIGGRVELISTGDPVYRPVNAHKQRQCAVLGVVAGGGGGILLIVLLGYVDRRLHTAQDAIETVGHFPLLGILPALPADLTDPAQAHLASYCVHHMRTLLQLRTPRGHVPVFAVTSPAGGTGKTSLTLALGLSFATSHARTLLIDSDLVGGGLTARLEAVVRRRIGQILCRQGRVTPNQVTEALNLAQRTGRRLGETLVELGGMEEAELTEALCLQERMSLGLLDALDSEELLNCVATTDIADLFILPLGRARGTDAGQVSPAAFARLLDQARRHFDVVLVDSGPLPGSMEAPMLVGQADGTITVVSQGDRRPQLEQTMRTLQDLGAPIAGVVFNRADERDIARNAYSSSANLSRRHGIGHRQAPIELDLTAATRAARFGPVAQAVMCAAATTEGESDA